jgi:hypothetical protein
VIDLSIVVASYETPALLAACLASIKMSVAASPSLSIEVIVVDNGSRDESLAMIKASGLNPNLVARRINRGFASAMNAGIRRAAGRHVLLLNSDVEIASALLDAAVARLDAESSIGILGPALVHVDGRPQRSIHALPGWASEFLGDRLARRLHGVERDHEGTGEMGPWREVEALRGAVLFVRRSLFDDVGLLDESYFFFLEETDFCARVRSQGHRIAYCPNLTAQHALGGSSKKRASLATRIEFHRSLYRFLARRRGVALARLAFVWRMLRSSVSAVGEMFAGIVVASARARSAERWGLVLWHLQGGPAEPGLAKALRETVADGPTS